MYSVQVGEMITFLYGKYDSAVCSEIFHFYFALQHAVYNWFNLVLYTVCSVLSECLQNNFTGDSGGIRTHDLLLTSADVLTSRPPSLPDDDWPARMLYIIH